MKKILIFYASYGGGHLSAAKSIQECLETSYTNIQIEVIDCIKYINRMLNKVTTGAYNECLLYTYPSPREGILYRMPASA